MIKFKKNKTIESAIKKISKNLDKNEQFRNMIFPEQSAVTLSNELRDFIIKHNQYLDLKSEIVEENMDSIISHYNGYLNFLNDKVEFIQCSVILKSDIPALTIQNKKLPTYNKYLRENLDLVAYKNDIVLNGFKNSFSSFLMPNTYDYMSIKESAEKATGDILVLGIRNGFYPYLCSLNNKVKTITIIENDTYKLDLFNEKILNKLKNNNVNVIFDDPATFFKEKDISIYNKIFINNYEDEYEGLYEYKKFLIANKNFNNIEFWLEDLILQNFREMVFTYLQLIYSFTDEKNLNAMKLIFIDSLGEEYKNVALGIINKFDNLNIIVHNEKEFLNYINNNNFIKELIMEF